METFTSSYLLNQPEFRATTLHYHSSNDHQEGTVSNGTKRAGSRIHYTDNSTKAHWKNVPVATFAENDITLIPACFTALSK